MGDSVVEIRLEGRVVADYVVVPDLDAKHGPRPYLHPVRTLAGVPVTDALPEDHVWHLGASLAVQDVAGTNLWGGRTYVRDAGYTWRDDHGRIVHDEWVSQADDRLVHRLRWCDADGAHAADRGAPAGRPPGRGARRRLGARRRVHADRRRGPRHHRSAVRPPTAAPAAPGTAGSSGGPSPGPAGPAGLHRRRERGGGGQRLRRAVGGAGRLRVHPGLLRPGGRRPLVRPSEHVPGGVCGVRLRRAARDRGRRQHDRASTAS